MICDNVVTSPPYVVCQATMVTPTSVLPPESGLISTPKTRRQDEPYQRPMHRHNVFRNDELPSHISTKRSVDDPLVCLDARWARNAVSERRAQYRNLCHSRYGRIQPLAQPTARRGACQKAGHHHIARFHVVLQDEV